MTTMNSPILNADRSASVSPSQVLLDGRLLLLVALIISIVQGELAHGGEVGLDAIEPGRAGRRPVELDVVGRGVSEHFGFVMKAGVVQHDVQRASVAIAATHPLQEAEERLPVFLFGEPAVQRVAVQVVHAEHVSHAAGAPVGRTQSIDVTGARVVFAVSRQQVQRAELVDAQAHALAWTAAIESLEFAVFWPELRVFRILPRLGVPPFDLVSPQDLPQPLDGDRLDDLLLDQVIAQLRQRPDAHADQLLRWREGDLGDLLDHVGDELARDELARPAVAQRRVPGDRVNASVIEAVDDLPHPLRRAVDAIGDLAVANSAARQQNDASVPAVDRVGQLPFHASQRPAFPRPQLPCRDLVHDGFSVSTVATTTETENPMRKSLENEDVRSAKVTDWKWH